MSDYNIKDQAFISADNNRLLSLNELPTTVGRLILFSNCEQSQKVFANFFRIRLCSVKIVE